MAEKPETVDTAVARWRVLLEDIVGAIERLGEATAAAQEAEEDILRMTRYVRRLLNENKPKEP